MQNAGEGQKTLPFADGFDYRVIASHLARWRGNPFSLPFFDVKHGMGMRIATSHGLIAMLLAMTYKTEQCRLF